MDLPDGVSVGTPAETTVSITDDDVPSVEVSFEQNSYTVAEGSTVTVKVRLSAEPERTVDITLVPANQGDTSDADYSLSATSLTFGPADTWRRPSPSTATDDAEDDDGESVKLTFVNLPAGVSVGTPAQTTVSITDDDLPSVKVSFELATPTPSRKADASTVDKRENEVTVKVNPQRPSRSGRWTLRWSRRTRAGYIRQRRLLALGDQPHVQLRRTPRRASPSRRPMTRTTTTGRP